ncbi:MAG: hypothetical protein ACOYYS_19715 [Chloroflexota bacterium]
MTIYRIVYGSTTVNLNDGSITHFGEYTPRPPGENDETVTDQVAVMVKGSAAQIQTVIQSVNLAFEMAVQRRKTKLGYQVFVEFQPNGYSTVYRAEIKSGRVELSQNLVLTSINKGYGEIAIFLEHTAWESSAEVAIPLTNGNGVDHTAVGLTVYNHNDSGAGHDNWVEIAAASIVGDRPAPVRLELRNLYTERISQIFVGNNWLCNGTQTFILEGEDASGGSTQAYAEASGGYYQQTPSMGTSETQLLDWTVSTATLNLMRANYFRFLLHLSSTMPANTYLKLKIKAELTTIYDGPWRAMQSSLGLVNVDTIKLPPYLVDAGDLYPLHLVLYGKNVSPLALNVDFAHLQTINSWRTYESVGYNVGQNVYLVDDNALGQMYTYGWATAGRLGNYRANGDKLVVMPGKKQYFTFSWRRDTGAAPIDMTMSVKAWYRPRRMTL